MDLHVSVVSQPVRGLRDDEAARALMEELDAIPRVSVRPAINMDVPAGAKAAGIHFAEILVALGAAGALLPTVITAIKDWLVRQPPSTTLRLKDGDLEFEWTGTTPPDLVNEFVSKLIARQKA